MSTTAPTKAPASAPVGALIAGAAVAAVQAIIPAAGGTQPNWALLGATFLVVFGATLAASLYHLQLPSGLQQVLIADLAATITAIAASHTHPAAAVPPPASQQPELAAPGAVTPA